jgi:hypothetical protein
VRPAGIEKDLYGLGGRERRAFLQQAQQYGELIAHGTPIDDHVQGAVLQQEFTALKSLG